MLILVATPIRYWPATHPEDVLDIPVIDIGPLSSGDPRAWQTITDSLREAHSTVGFSILVNTGVCRKTIRDLFDASERFHRLPIEQKMLLRYGENLRGYLPLNTSKLTASTLGSARRPNHSDSFVILDEMPEALRANWTDSTMGGVQKWPAQVDGFERAARCYRDAMVRLGESLIPSFASMLGLARDGLSPHFAPPNTILRLLHYPAVRCPEPGWFGSAPHTDYGCLTLVAQDGVGGLEVQAADGKWLAVPVIENSLVLNTGQIVAGWSGGRIKATPHRVVNHPAKERYSIAFFFDCGLETPLDIGSPLQSTSKQRDTSATYGQHIERILRTNYSFTREL